MAFGSRGIIIETYALDTRCRRTSGGSLIRFLVTGGAGFIGSSVCDFLVSKGSHVVALDNFSSGSKENIAELLSGNGRFTLMKGDCKSLSDVKKAIQGVDSVLHLSANPEVRPDRTSPETCFNETLLATKVVLEAASQSRISHFVYASSSTVYGDAKLRPTHEDYSPLIPVSIYGAAKLGAEALIAGYSKVCGFNAYILRLANVIGPRSGHGVVPDFVAKLRKDPKRLEILGDGTQTKSYLYIDDCVDALLRVISRTDGVAVYNVGSEDQANVMRIAEIVCHEMGVAPAYDLTGGVDGGRGWVGDVKQMLLDVGRLKSLGWAPRYSSEEAVRVTVKRILGKD